jgi:truncated hemoglobin YjbI
MGSTCRQRPAAPLFATLSLGHSRREAAVLAEVFGGAEAEDEPAAVIRQEHAGSAFPEEQRARWVALASLTADEAALRADPECSAALTSYLDWSSRVAAAQSVDTAPP